MKTNSSKQKTNYHDLLRAGSANSGFSSKPSQYKRVTRDPPFRSISSTSILTITSSVQYNYPRVVGKIAAGFEIKHFPLLLLLLRYYYILQVLIESPRPFFFIFCIISFCTKNFRLPFRWRSLLTYQVIIHPSLAVSPLFACNCTTAQLHTSLLAPGHLCSRAICHHPCYCLIPPDLPYQAGLLTIQSRNL